MKNNLYTQYFSLFSVSYTWRLHRFPNHRLEHSILTQNPDNSLNSRHFVIPVFHTDLSMTHCLAIIVTGNTLEANRDAK